MIQPFHHNNLLSEFVANPSNEAWAKDLVCLSAKKNGFLESVDYEYVLNEMENQKDQGTVDNLWFMVNGSGFMIISTVNH